MDNSENLRVRRDYSFFSYLLLCNKSPKNLMTQTNNKYLLSHTYICGSGTQEQLICLVLGRSLMNLQSKCQPGLQLSDLTGTIAFAFKMLTHITTLLVLAVGRGSPQFFATWIFSQGCSSVKMTFSRVNEARELGRSPHVFYTLASKVVLCHLCNNHTVQPCSVWKRLNRT